MTLGELLNSSWMGAGHWKDEALVRSLKFSQFYRTGHLTWGIPCCLQVDRVRPGLNCRMPASVAENSWVGESTHISGVRSVVSVVDIRK